jgi:hypothetical protein
MASIGLGTGAVYRERCRSTSPFSTRRGVMRTSTKCFAREYAMITCPANPLIKTVDESDLEHSVTLLSAFITRGPGSA